MFGLRHSGLNGQRVTDAVTWIHRNLGLEYTEPESEQPISKATSRTSKGLETSMHPALVLDIDLHSAQPYNSINYSDDLAGCEAACHRATAAFLALGNLLEELGLKESTEKACAPATSMTYLGVLFNTVDMTMSVPADKLQEVRADLEVWARKTTAVRKDLQSILGKLFWISKVVRHSRAFMGRLLH